MLTLGLATIILGCGSPAGHANRMETSYRWFMCSSDLQKPQGAEQTIKAIETASAAGYNGVLLDEVGFRSLKTISPAYLNSIQQVMSAAKRHNLELIPVVGKLGAAQDYLDRNPSLVESSPYFGSRFIAAGGMLRTMEPPIPIVNGSFEAFLADIPATFKASHQSDVIVAQDTAEHHSGGSSLRVDGQPSSQRGRGGENIEQPLVLKPWHQYRLSLWTKAKAPGASAVYLNAFSYLGKQVGSVQCQLGADWTRNDLVFNSLGEVPIKATINVQSAHGANVWIDDLAIEDVALMNITHRDDCQVVIKGEDGVVYSEGLDVLKIVDPEHQKPGGPGHFDLTHMPPVPVIPPNSRIHEGQIVNIDYYAALIDGGPPTICPKEPKSRAMMNEEMQRVFSLLHPHFVLVGVDDVRTLGWDPGCETVGGPAGGILAGFVRDEIDLAKKFDSKVQVVTFSDMFDPYGNAREPYFMARGGTEDSAHGLPKDTIILNDNYLQSKESLGFFARNGFSQVVLGYCDKAEGVLAIDQWQKNAAGLPGIKGFGYATYLNDFSSLAEFAHTALSVTP